MENDSSSCSSQEMVAMAKSLFRARFMLIQGLTIHVIIFIPSIRWVLQPPNCSTSLQSRCFTLHLYTIITEQC